MTESDPLAQLEALQASWANNEFLRDDGVRVYSLDCAKELKELLPTVREAFETLRLECYKFEEQTRVIRVSSELPLWDSLERLRELVSDDEATPQENFGYLLGQVERLLAKVGILEAEVARLTQERDDIEDPKCEFCPNRGVIQICTHCWNGANNDTWQRRAVQAEAEVARLHLMIEMMNSGT